ncbi:hypothetical protein [Actinophytocola xanthii]|uniref:Uncharacterized protein n=1 Tax=Actinophytocola xanthii TaxID=1912961 RepID=A0A1Q8CR05_9PSEU|nr:hypothetical protein [Actinophytocola xanthii]OLF16790.1 hypothetical protein BU204_15105 [Actinophytocola xanthii]
MDIEKLIAETFRAHEHEAPDGDAVLAAARERVDRRRFVRSRPLLVAAAAAVLTVVAVVVVGADRSVRQADQTAARGSEAAAPQVVQDLKMPFSLGWLPQGSAAYSLERMAAVPAPEDPSLPLFGGEYQLTVTTGGQKLYVGVQELKMSPPEGAVFKSGPGRAVTVAGRRGVESANPGGEHGYELYLAHPDRGSLYVHVSGNVAPARLVEVGRRIAENVRFPGSATVTPTFGLHDLPPDRRICGFGVQPPSDHVPKPITEYNLGTCTDARDIVVQTRFEQPLGTAGRLVLGRATREVSVDGYHTLWVLDAVDDTSIAIAGHVPMTELYDIADRLVLPS